MSESSRPVAAADVAAYQNFVRGSREREESYWFDERRCRFDLEPNDALVLAPGAVLRKAALPNSAPTLELPGSARIALTNVAFAAAERALALLPCRESELRLALGAEAAAFLGATWGSALFSPAALFELEQALPATEIVRFPGSPYEVVRAYWRNMIDVRRRLTRTPRPLHGAQLRRSLTSLHRVALLGEAGTSFYLPASPIGRKRVAPGELYELSSELDTSDEAAVVLLRGPRVGLGLSGGIHYWRSLAESVGEPEALAESRELREAGVDWGRLVVGRAQHESELRPWFLPPRPLTEAHFELMSSELAAAEAAAARADEAALLGALAGFHQRFVRLHPFASANQSLAMSFVNELLGRSRGSGIPHLILDQLALRFGPSAYRRLFARAVHAWSVSGGTPAGRLRELLARRTSLERVVVGLARAQSFSAAGELLTAAPQAAKLALLSDSP